MLPCRIAAEVERRDDPATTPRTSRVGRSVRLRPTAGRMGSWRLAVWCIAAFFLMSGGANAQHRDRLTVKLFPGSGLQSAHERMEVQFERVRYPTSARPAQPDGFFDEIERILSTHGIAEDWQYVFPDGAFIRIGIEIGNRRVELASAHVLYERDGRMLATERGLVALDGRNRKRELAKESDAFRSRRLAFEEILALVAARVQQDLGP